MNTNSTIRLLAIFTLTLSMIAFAGTTRITPGVHLVRADYITTNPAQNSLNPNNQWVPAGPMVDKILVSTYDGEGPEFLALNTNTIDETDWTFSTTDAPNSCPSGTALACDSRFWANQPGGGVSQVASYGMFGIDFNHSNTIFGINFGSASATNPDNAKAIHFRQGIAHLIDRQQVVSKIFGNLGQAMDNPVPPGQSFPHSGLPKDTTAQGAGSTGPYCINQTTAATHLPPCVAGDYSLEGVCGAAVAGVNGGWDSLDAQFRTAGQTCSSAFKYGTDTTDGAGIVLAAPTNPDFCDAADHWIAAGLATARAADCSLNGFAIPALTGGHITFIVRRDNSPRLAIGQGLASTMCRLINGAASPATCAQIGINLLSIQETRPIVFDTSIQHHDWDMYTLGWGLGSTPEQVWGLFNSAFAGRWCGGTPGPLGSDYIYNCNANFDRISNMIEFNATNAGALASLQVAAEDFGKRAVSIDIYAQNDVFAYRKEWTGLDIAKGLGIPTYFAQLNAWSAAPQACLPGPAPNCGTASEFRWGWKQGVATGNPMNYATQWEFQFWELVYDSLIAVNPYSPTDPFGWMVNQYQVLAPQPGDAPGTVSDIKFNLRNDIFFHDGRQVTASDYLFSIQAFANTGGLINSLTAGVVGCSTIPAACSVRIQNDFNFIVNLNSASVFAIFNVGGIPLLPQHTLAADTTTKCTTVNTPACNLAPAPTPTGFVDTADLVATNQFIGSGPMVCRDLTTQAIGGKCTSTGVGSVPFGNSIVLTRDGYGQAGTANSAYFRDSAKYKQWQWADVFNHGTVDILDVSSAASCLGKPVTGGLNPNCLHWDTKAATITCSTAAGNCNSGSLAGLGGNGGGTVTFIEIQQAFRWFGVSWTAPQSYTSLSNPTGCGGTGCGAATIPQTLYEGGITYGP